MLHNIGNTFGRAPTIRGSTYAQGAGACKGLEQSERQYLHHYFPVMCYRRFDFDQFRQVVPIRD